jgi:ABC-type Fe3+/spermidine/putrescine transport system ATPase subunit
MNLFEGRVNSSANGTLDVTIEGLGRLEVPHDGEASGDIGIAIRPEKLRVTTEQPGESCICFTAVLDNVAYHGSESHMFFTTDSGAKLAATVQNETRTRAPFAAGERLWVSWIPGDTLVLGE